MAEQAPCCCLALIPAVTCMPGKPRYPKECVFVTTGEKENISIGLGGKLFCSPLVKAEDCQPWQLEYIGNSDMWLWGRHQAFAVRLSSLRRKQRAPDSLWL